jgi:hypothetical protein
VKSKVTLMLLAVMSFGVLVVSAQTPRPRIEGDGDLGTPRAVSPYVTEQRTYFSPALGFGGAQSQEEGTLSNQASKLARQLGSAKADGDREKLKTELGTILEKQFELRQQRHKKEIDSLEAQVKKLKDLVDKRQENRREIVAKRLDQILQEAQGLGW